MIVIVQYNNKRNKSNKLKTNIKYNNGELL